MEVKINYYKLKNIKYKNNTLIIIFFGIVGILLFLLIFLQSYDNFVTYASFNGKNFIIPVKLENSDIISKAKILKIDDKTYNFSISSISKIFNENYINYQNYEITVPVKFKNNEVKKITFYYKKERMIKKILKLIL